VGLLVGEPGAVLVGFDFAFGYPADAGLPSGRAPISLSRVPGRLFCFHRTGGIRMARNV